MFPLTFSWQRAEGDPDHVSMTSDLGDEIESTVSGTETVTDGAEASDGTSTSDAEYVNPRGVRFTQVQGKDGQFSYYSCLLALC